MRRPHLVALSLAALAAWVAAQEPPRARFERSPESLARGRELYDAHCRKCHGPEGKGDGPERGETLPAPRDFTRKQFRYVTTENRAPSPEDLARVIRRGLPGTAMAGVADLAEADVWALAYRVQELAGTEPEPKPLAVAPRPEDPDLRRKGSRLFLANCAKCHGAGGKGDGAAAGSLKDDDGRPVRPRNLVDDPLRGGSEPEQVYCRIKLGLPGSSMVPPVAFPALKDEQAWALVEFVLGLREPKK